MRADDLFLLTGSNEGDRSRNLAQAAHLLTQVLGTPAAVSSIYQTAAWGKTNQPAFLNQVLAFRSAMPAHDVLQLALQTERQLGRIRTEKWGQRLIDIDILLYADQVMQENDLVIPHPFLHQRRFTLVPLCEIAGGFRHPVLNKTLQQLLDECSDPLDVTPWPTIAT